MKSKAYVVKYSTSKYYLRYIERTVLLRRLFLMSHQIFCHFTPLVHLSLSLRCHTGTARQSITVHIHFQSENL